MHKRIRNLTRNSIDWLLGAALVAVTVWLFVSLLQVAFGPSEPITSPCASAPVVHGITPPAGYVLGRHYSGE